MLNDNWIVPFSTDHVDVGEAGKSKGLGGKVVVVPHVDEWAGIGR